MTVHDRNLSTQERSAWEQAKALELPTRDAVLRRSPSVSQFWNDHSPLFVEAWQEWENQLDLQDATLDDSILAPALKDAIQKAWSKPEEEVLVKELWQEVFPGVFQAQFFDPEKLKALRTFLEATVESGIPTRAPYGIALNRHGAMLDPRSEGYLAAPSFQTFYSELMNRYMRPIARLLFPEVVGFDSQTFGFSIRYQPGMDTSLQPHTDASAATLNINMNLPEEHFTGSEVDFFDPTAGRVKRVSFEPGMALIHAGSVPHTAQPITSGTRSNMVLWLYGSHGQIPRGIKNETVRAADERWVNENVTKDGFAPF